jgi:hypothetical protein
VKHKDERYILCYNPEEAQREEAKRQEILDVLSKKAGNAKSLIGNRGYKRYIKAQGFEIDWDKVKQEARYDGKSRL